MKPKLSTVILRGFEWEHTPEGTVNPRYWNGMCSDIGQLESEEKQTSRADDLANFITRKNPKLDLQVGYSEQNPETSIAVYKSCKIICTYLARFDNLPSVGLLKTLVKG